MDMNFMDAKTGHLVFHNIMITKNTHLSDLAGVPDLLADPKDGHILIFRKSVKAGKVNARVRISFKKTPVITITPMAGKSGENMLDLSKMWLRAMLPNEVPADENEDLIFYEYGWGTITAQYVKNKDEKTGGWIEIRYKKEKI